ncbi:MAG TPA: hypothetical protein VIX20_00685 [Ktedonobacteraceae bacterium]
MQRKHFKGYVFSILALTVLLVSMISMGAVFAKGSNHSIKSSGGVTLSSTKVNAPAATEHTVNLMSLPVETSKPAVNHRQSLFMSSTKYAAAKKAASTNKNAPKGGAALSDPGTTKSGIFGFNGMADSATICPYFGGCQPPDMALATSPQFVLQGVNTSYAIYDTAGHTVVGPINDTTWYGVPPLPGNCDPAGPFLSDPRAFYDPNTGLFWTATLQVEAAAFGVGVNCPNQSTYWIANLNPHTLVMHVYAFDMTLGGVVNAGADYTQFGFSGSTVSFTGNMFDFTTGNYDFAEVQFADKATMEQGLPVTSVAFTQLGFFNVFGNLEFVDTVQPVETETTAANDPGVQYLVNSFNIFGDPNGNDCFFSACSGFIVWAFDPSNSTLGGSFVASVGNSPAYVTPPNADQPGCIQCVETIDTRITGTPVYSVGGGQPLISFSLDTAITNGGASFPSVVPGVLWGQIQVSHFSSIIVSASLAQSGYVFFSGDRAASFGAMMQDKNGKLFMVFDTMSANLNPSIMLVSRNASDPLGTIGNARFIIKGPSATFNSRWGDFEATSYSGFNNGHVWVASQYSISGDWATFIARVS